jgi:hypothetical protein
MRHHLALRDDQVACVQQAIAQNTVVHLRTGGGKTLVAVRVIDHFLRAARARADAGVADDAAASPPQRIPQHQQVVVFVVPTRVLVAQQASYCREHMHVDVDAASAGTRGEGASARVAELCGNEMDRWTEALWARCISDHEVLVGTAEVFRKALVDHAFLKVQELDWGLVRDGVCMLAVVRTFAPLCGGMITEPARVNAVHEVYGRA